MIASITPFTLLDFPSNLACILWFKGCNLRCRYCYNFEFLNPQCKSLTEDRVFDFLKERIGFLDGVVLSGGECTLWGDKLIKLARKIKAMGFKIKLDTNATNPQILSCCLKENLLDYVALDFKALPLKYKNVCGVDQDLFETFQICFEILQKSKLNFEVRSTYHSEILTPNDLVLMAKMLKDWGYQGNYYVQDFVGNKGSLGNLGVSTKLEEIQGIIKR